MNWYKFAIKKEAFRDAPGEGASLQDSVDKLEKSIELFEMTNKRVVKTAKEIEAGAKQIGSEDLNDITNLQAIANNLNTFETELNDFYDDQLSTLLGSMYNQARQKALQPEPEVEPEVESEPEVPAQPARIEKGVPA